MIHRCENPRRASFKDYGARGIRVCARWRKSFHAFVSDLGIPKPGMQLDRIDNDGNYEPGNVRWVTRVENLRNRRNSRPVVVEGLGDRSLADLATRHGLKTSTLRMRVHSYGWSLDKALATPVNTACRRKTTKKAS